MPSFQRDYEPKPSGDDASSDLPVGSPENDPGNTKAPPDRGGATGALADRRGLWAGSGRLGVLGFKQAGVLDRRSIVT